MSTDNVTNFAAELLQEVDDKIGELKEVLVEKITDEAERLESFEAKLIADQATLENSRSDFESNVKPFADLDENRKNLERNVADLQNRWLELDDEMRHLEAVHQSLDIERDLVVRIEHSHVDRVPLPQPTLIPQPALHRDDMVKQQRRDGGVVGFRDAL